MRSLPPARGGNKPGPSEAQKLQFACIASRSKAPDPLAFQIAHDFADGQVFFWRDLIEMAFYGSIHLGDVGVKITTPTVSLSRSTAESCGTAVDKLLTPNTKDWDNNSFWDAGLNPSRITFMASGLYLFGASVQFSTLSTISRMLSIRVNGGTLRWQQRDQGGQNQTGRLSTTGLWYFNAADYIQALVFCNAASQTCQLMQFWALAITPEQVT